MDEMRINSKFLKGIFGKVIGKKLSKAIGCDVSFTVNNVHITSNPEKREYKIHLDIDGTIDQENMERLIFKLM